MRYVTLSSFLFATAILFAAPSSVSAAGWCLLSAREGSTLCRFQTLGQCMASRTSNSDTCIVDLITPQSQSTKKASGAATAKKPIMRETLPRVEQPARSAPTAAPSAPAVAAPPAAGSLPANFAAARQLVFDGQYAAGIAAMHALGLDDHPEIATYIGFAHSKLGRIDQARFWYDKALAANPNHLLTLSFYGMLHANRGDLRLAQDDLEKLRRLCGTDCNEYKALEGVLAAKTR
jgi:tetratricopeptide (TPR) repeat protein